MVELSYFALILLVTCCLASGVVASVIHTWALRARTYSLEDRVGILEGVSQREVKIRAAQARFKAPTKEELAVEAALVSQPPPPPRNWWEVSLPRSVPHGK